MTTDSLSRLMVETICGLLIAGCSRGIAIPQTQEQSQPTIQRNENVSAPRRVRRAIAPVLQGQADCEQPQLADKVNVEPVRQLIKRILEMDAMGKLNEAELDMIMAEMPECGSISGIGDVLCELVSGDKVEDRLDALALLSAVRRVRSVETNEDPNEAPGSTPENPEESTTPDGADVETATEVAESTTPTESPDAVQELESAMVMKAVTTCLTDSDATVRAAALETVQSLPPEERDALSLQILGNDDASLKLALLSESNHPEQESDITLNFHGLDSDDPEVKKLASDNLTSMLGMTFESSEAAFEWWENHNPSLAQ